MYGREYLTLLNPKFYFPEMLLQNYLILEQTFEQTSFWLIACVIGSSKHKLLHSIEIFVDATGPERVIYS